MQALHATPHAPGLRYKAQQGAVQSFKRTLTYDDQAMRRGTELDRRVEQAREAQLCNNLVILAASSKWQRNELPGDGAADRGSAAVLSAAGAADAAAAEAHARAALGRPGTPDDPMGREHPGRLTRHVRIAADNATAHGADARGENGVPPVPAPAPPGPPGPPGPAPAPGPGPVVPGRTNEVKAEAPVPLAFVKQRPLADNPRRPVCSGTPALTPEGTEADREGRGRTGRSRRHGGLSEKLGAMHARIEDVVTSHEELRRDIAHLTSTMLDLNLSVLRNRSAAASGSVPQDRSHQDSTDLALEA
jgi:hypothetical protein